MSFILKEKLISQGIQSEIEIGEWDGKPAIRKISGKGLNKRELDTVANAVNPYRDNLQRVGVDVPRNHQVSRVNGTVETIDEFVSGELVYDSAKHGSLSGWYKMLHSVLCADGGRTFVDAKPQNYIENNGKAIYIDTFPPMLRHHDDISPWIQALYKRDRKMMAFNFGDIRGQTTKMLSLAKRENPQYYQEIAIKTLEFLNGKIPQSDWLYICEQVERGFPDMNEMYANPDNAKKVVYRIKTK